MPLRSFRRLCLIVSVLVGTPSFAHFQMIYTPEFLLERGGSLLLAMPFTHPGSQGAVMAIGKPQAFYRVTQQGKDDLMASLNSVKWGDGAHQGGAFEAHVSHKAMGDYTYIFEASPYYEASEDIFIQQYAKLTLNVGGLPTHWDKVYSLPIEIVPLQMPYKVYAGSTFRGQVLQAGKPVPHANIEVELLNYQPSIHEKRFASTPTYVYPSSHFSAISLKADEQGIFIFGIPKEGIWGFTGVVPDAMGTYQGKPLSEEAVLWVQAKALK